MTTMRLPHQVSVADQTSSELRRFAQGMAPSASRSASILANLADDIEADGPIGRILLDHPAADSPLFALRALAGVNQLVLAGDAPELARRLSAPATADPGEDHARIWASTRSTILTHTDRIWASLDRPVQQHQPDRAAQLLRGLSMLKAPRVRLLELGACAGLNLVLDRYHWAGPGWTWGDPRSPVRLPGVGPAPGDVTIVERGGCDLDPRDPADPRDALILRSFLAPEHDAARRQLDGAIGLAARAGVAVERASATEWLRGQLAKPSEPDVYTVVWHSLFWLYLDEAEQSEIESVLTHAAQSRPVARVAFEPLYWVGPVRLQVTVY